VISSSDHLHCFASTNCTSEGKFLALLSRNAICICAAFVMSGWLDVTFVYCVETAKDTAIVAMECK